MKKIPFSKPSFSHEDITDIKTKIGYVLSSGWLTSGPKVEEFEKKYASHIGCKHTVALSSGTAALHTSLLALGIGVDHEVIVPADTYVATANTVLYVGAKPVFADSDPDTFNISPKAIRNKITKRTKAIIVVHLGGNPCDMNEINEMAKEYALYVIEDAAHAIGSKYKDQFCGALGTIGAFSFYPNKIITTAEGGLVSTNNDEVNHKIKIIRNQGRDSYGPSEIRELGFTYRLSDVHATIGLSQIKYINKFVKQRNKIAQTYNKGLSKYEFITHQVVKKGNLSSYYAYIIKLDRESPVKRDELIKLLKGKGIETSILFTPVHLQEIYYRLFGDQRGSYPIAEELGEFGLALPIYNDMSSAEASYVLKSINEIFDNTGS